MKSNIFRTLKACLLRRKLSKSPSSNTIASFYAGPEHLRNIDDCTHGSVPSIIPTITISSPSQCEAMLTTASIEIGVRADDDGDYEGHINRDSISTLSSVTCVESFAESEDIFPVAEDVNIIFREFEDPNADTTSVPIPLPVLHICVQRHDFHTLVRHP